MTVESFENKELSLIERARRYYKSGDYDIAVTECYKAIETSLRKKLFNIGIYPKTSRDLVRIAFDKGIVTEGFLQIIDFIRMKRNMAVNNIEPISKEQAFEVLKNANTVIASFASFQNEDINNNTFIEFLKNRFKKAKTN